MNLETQVKADLWNAIERSYSSGNYTHAILDAMSVVTDVLRDKSGLDIDGYKLVGAALSFNKDKPPRIKINKLQTQTEQDEQRGLMQVLEGMYTLVRNPRSHERLDDSKHTADTVILFIDYLLNFLGESQQSFTVQEFLNMVTDPYFVPDGEYVKGLVNTIPARKRGDTLIELCRNNNWEKANNFEWVIKELLNRVTDTEVENLLSVVSEDMRKVNKVGAVTLIIKVLPDYLWPRIDQMPRLRAEKMLLDEFETAWYDPGAQQRTNSAASTWLQRIAKHYSRKSLLRAAIIKKLKAKDFDQHNFVAKYFLLFDALPDIFEGEQQIKSCVVAICNCLRVGNGFIKDSLAEWLCTSSPEEWRRLFSESLSNLTDLDNPEYCLPDGTPFLGKFVMRSNPVSEVPEEYDGIPF